MRDTIERIKRDEEKEGSRKGNKKEWKSDSIP